MTNRYNAIYMITNKVNGMSYIGSAVDFLARKQRHIRDLDRHLHRNRHLQHAWNKYGSENFIFEIIDNVDEPEQLTDREQWWLDSFVWDNLYNLSPTAGSLLGFKMSDETRQTMSKNNGRPHLGKKLSKAHRDKIATSMLGQKRKPHTKETKEKIRKANSGENNYNYGGTLSEETKNKISKANKGQKKTSESIEKRLATLQEKYGGSPNRLAVYQIDKNTDEIINTFDSITQASEETGISHSGISRVCNKKPNYVTAGGYKWKFVEKE